MNKIHYLIDRQPYETQRTRCGVNGHFDRITQLECVTAVGNRFEVSEDVKQVTCKRCLKGIDK